MTETRPLLVGEAPSVRMMALSLERRLRWALFPHPPGCAGYRLCQYMHLWRGEYLKMFERVNLVEHTATPTMTELREGFQRNLVTTVPPTGRTMLLVGTRVARAAYHPHPPPRMLTWLAWSQERGGHAEFAGNVAWVPHTSGRSCWWNDPGNRRRGEAFLRMFANETRVED